MGVRRLLGGFAFLAAGAFVTQLVGFVALAVAARKLGPDHLGAASFALSVSLYFAIPANFGVAILGIRDVAREPERAREIAGEVMALRAMLSLACFALLVALSPVIASDPEMRTLLPIAGVTFLVGALDGEWLLQGRQRLPAVAVARFAGQAVYAVLLVTLISQGAGGARLYVWLTVLSILISALVAQAITWRGEGGPPRLTLDRTRLCRRLAASAPLGIAVVMVQIYFSLDSVMLGYLRNTAAVGQYAVAYKIPMAVYGVVHLWSAALYPQVAQMITRDRAGLAARVGTFTSASIALALAFGAGATVLGRDLIPELFGGAYRPAGTPFILLAWSLALAIVSVNVGSVLAAGGDERRYALGVGMGALINVLINFWAIPAYGTIGAASATIAAEVVVIVYMTVRYRRIVGRLPLARGRIARAAAAAGVMAGVLAAVPGSVDAVARAAGGVVVFAAAAVALGAVTPRELRSVMGSPSAHGPR